MTIFVDVVKIAGSSSHYFHSSIYTLMDQYYHAQYGYHKLLNIQSLNINMRENKVTDCSQRWGIYVA